MQFQSSVKLLKYTELLKLQRNKAFTPSCLRQTKSIDSFCYQLIFVLNDTLKIR